MVTPNPVELTVKINHQFIHVELILTPSFVIQKGLPWQMAEWVFGHLVPAPAR